MTKADIEKHLKALGVNIPVVFYEQTDSTNTRAKEYAKAHAENRTPMLFVADSQTAGRGRMGRSFVSNGGAGIYMSLLTYPDERGFDATSATARAAVSICRAIDELCGTKTEIKWVNDVYLGGKKLAGILCEGEVLQGGEIGYLIIGMGINVYKNAISDEISHIATSIESEANIVPDRDTLIAKIIEKAITSDASDFDEYKKRSLVIGTTVKVIKACEQYEARVIDLNDDFSLLLDCGGKIERLFTGEVSIKI
jgi:BirA family biotin operon repressor/biotin-[acetyl-CoA-carboxylase] ligase